MWLFIVKIIMSTESGSISVYFFATTGVCFIGDSTDEVYDVCLT